MASMAGSASRRGRCTSTSKFFHCGKALMRSKLWAGDAGQRS
jgi:hypothetical protein